MQLRTCVQWEIHPYNAFLRFVVIRVVVTTDTLCHRKVLQKGSQEIGDGLRPQARIKWMFFEISLNASFQALSFEKSNETQFIYALLPRSKLTLRTTGLKDSRFAF
uniref:Uncharacterized protein n=1 Tax=Steinernema glaseri TaxID=37863 RepID=A0A1I8A646_9BILA